MFFRNLIQAWRGRRFLAGVLDEFGAMLRDGEEMYRLVAETFLAGHDPERVRTDLRDRDRQVNAREESIRRKLVQHLAMDPGSEAMAALVMMSVVKDAERVGDYCKNMLGVLSLLSAPLPEPWHSTFSGLVRRVAELFPATTKAFLETAEAEATRLMNTAKGITGECDARLREIAASDLPANTAACGALLTRYLKRIAGHLENVASAVIQPVHRLDHRPKD